MSKNCILSSKYRLQSLVKTGIVGTAPSWLPFVSLIFLFSIPLALALTTAPLTKPPISRRWRMYCWASTSISSGKVNGKVFASKSEFAPHFLASSTHASTSLRYASFQPLIVLCFKASLGKSSWYHLIAFTSPWSSYNSLMYGAARFSFNITDTSYVCSPDAITTYMIRKVGFLSSKYFSSAICSTLNDGACTRKHKTDCYYLHWLD